MRGFQALWVFVHIILCSHMGNGNEISENADDLDIRRAVNTSETLWLFWQTYTNGFLAYAENKTFDERETCIHNKLFNISKTDCHFTQFMNVDEEDAKIDTTYRGIFNFTEPPKSMQVIDPAMPNAPELWTLQYQDPDNGRCMVFLIQQLDNVIRDDIGTCELYIRGTPRQSDPPENCRTFYQERCNMTKIYQPYQNSCQEETVTAETTDGNNILNSS